MGDPGGGGYLRTAARGHVTSIAATTTFSPADHGIRPLHLGIPRSDLDDLDDLHDPHNRLDRTRRPDELPGAGWAYDVPLEYLRELVRYWRHDDDRRAAEAG